MTQMQQIKDATQACIAKAEQMYGIDLSQVRVTFDLKGAAMGMARWKINRMSRTVSHLQLRFNLRMCAEDMHDAINDTVPHEVAHIVNAVAPHTGANHNAGWRNVCLRLGGTGKTYHDQEVIYAKGKTYAYTASCGKVINLSEQRHKKIQRGAVLPLKSGGKLSKACEYTVVGVSGRRVKGAPQKAGVAAPQQAAAKKPATPEAPKVALPTKGTAKKQSNAELIREAIKRCKRMEFARDIAVDYGVDDLGMTRALARKYVNENWDKV